MPSELLKLVLLQADLSWENAKANREKISSMLAELNEADADLIILPEMWSTGFSMNADQFAEEMNGESVKYMAFLAKEKNAVVTGSLIIKEEDGCFYNRLLWVRPDGEYDSYDKRHLFSLAKEEDTYTEGRSRLIVELKGWRVCPLICYDLRFPVWSRNRNEYDLLIYVANWPERRAFAWKQLLIARAIENQTYVAAVNRVGADGNNVIHSGDSIVLGPAGECVSQATVGKEQIFVATLSYDELIKFRTNFTFLNDADEFDLKI